MYIKPLSLIVICSCFLYGFVGENLAQAKNVGTDIKNSSSEVTKKRTVKQVPAMRNRVYSQLARAQKLSDEGDKQAGFEVLEQVKTRLSSLNSYERAMLWNFYAFMHYSHDNINSAIKHFSLVIEEEAIPDALYLSTLYSLAQLSMQQEKYSQALGYLQQWQANNDKVLTASQHITFAQIYYQDKQFDKVITEVKQALAVAATENISVKENWLILLRASYYEQNQPENVVKVIEQLVRLFDKSEYWLQLAAMYGEVGEEEKQLAVMEASWQAGHITQANDVMTLAQLYRFHQVPYKAAVLLEQAIESGIVVPSEKSLAALAQAYIAAKEDEKALPILTKASEISETGKFDMQLAQAYFNLERWQEAILAANHALERGELDRQGDMYLVIGMAQFNLHAYDEALIAFTQARKIPQSAKTAKQWFHYVEREQNQSKRLAMLN